MQTYFFTQRRRHFRLPRCCKALPLCPAASHRRLCCQPPRVRPCGGGDNGADAGCLPCGACPAPAPGRPRDLAATHAGSSTAAARYAMRDPGWPRYTSPAATAIPPSTAASTRRRCPRRPAQLAPHRPWCTTTAVVSPTAVNAHGPSRAAAASAGGAHGGGCGSASALPPPRVPPRIEPARWEFASFMASSTLQAMRRAEGCQCYIPARGGRVSRPVRT